MTLDDWTANMRTHEQMLAEAQKIHPDMKVRLAADERSWEMFMPTPYEEHYQLEEKYRGTPAWTLYEERDNSYDNSLQRYRHKNGFDTVPLAGVAEYINLREEQQVWAGPVQARLHAENNSDITEEEWPSVSNDKFSAYQRTQNQVADLMRTEFADRWAALKEKWDM